MDISDRQFEDYRRGGTAVLRGEFIETRLITSGQRPNPRFAEPNGRELRPGELVTVDTDTIGYFGYYSDSSRSFRCGAGLPAARRRSGRGLNATGIGAASAHLLKYRGAV